jgi:predicted enzyme related to lactoylglutathione lyase
MDIQKSRSPFCHVVIPAPDLAKAKAFYEAIFGWRVQANFPEFSSAEKKTAVLVRRTAGRGTDSAYTQSRR